MSIYLNKDEKFNNIPFQQIPWLPCFDSKDQKKYLVHEKIGFLWSEIFSQIQAGKDQKDKEFISVLESLGVSPDDQEAHNIHFDLIQKMKAFDFTVAKTKEMGMFHLLDKNQQPFAVFKTGEKRAFMELSFRQILPSELKEHAIAGLFCSLKNPDLSEKGLEVDSELSVNLWNGNVKVILGPPDEGDYYLNGILEPFLQKNKQANLDLLLSAKTLLAFLFFGSRDIKTDGLIDYCSVDNEEGMPPYLDVCDQEKDQFVAATNLPYLLEHPHQNTLLSLDEIKALQKITESWNSIKIMKALSSMSIQFPDAISESYSPKGILSCGQEMQEEYLKTLKIRLDAMSEEKDDNSKVLEKYKKFSRQEVKDQMRFIGWDEGYCEMDVRRLYGNEEQELKKLLDPIDVDGIKQVRAFTDNQINACISRIERIKKFINEKVLNKQMFSLWELVLGVDHVFARHYQLKLEEKSGSSSSSMSSSSLSFRDLVCLGRTTPNPEVSSTKSFPPRGFFKPIVMERSRSLSAPYDSEEKNYTAPA
jgi:hypothetical protein